MSAKHPDGSTCMADFWEQSAKLLQARVEEYEQVIGSLWNLIPPQQPSEEFKVRVARLLSPRQEGE